MKSTKGANWENEINKKGGVSIEKQLAVPYTEEDSYAALIKTVDKINYGKIGCALHRRGFIRCINKNC